MFPCAEYLLLWIFLSWQWAAFSLQCCSCCTLWALVLYLGLELLCALRSRSPPSRSVQETLSLSPGGPRGEVRRECDLGLQLWKHFWPVPSAQGWGEPWEPTCWRAEPPWSTPGRVPSGSWDPRPQWCLQVLRLLHSLSLLMVRLQRPTVPVCHRWGTSSWPMLSCCYSSLLLLSCVQFLATPGLQHNRVLCPSLSPLHGSQPCPGEGDA